MKHIEWKLRSSRTLINFSMDWLVRVSDVCMCAYMCLWCIYDVNVYYMCCVHDLCTYMYECTIVCVRVCLSISMAWLSENIRRCGSSPALFQAGSLWLQHCNWRTCWLPRIPRNLFLCPVLSQKQWGDRCGFRGHTWRSHNCTAQTLPI